MDTYMVVLRIVHILAGVFWVGAAFTTILFLQPTAREVGPAAGPFMAHLAGKKRLVDWVLLAAGLTVLAGLLMYWRVSGGLDPDWIGSAPGISLTVGALCAIAAFSLGLAILIGVGRKLAVRVYRLGADERQLMTTGLHRYVQHPFYLQFLLLPVGLFLLTLNYLAVLVFISYNTLWGPRFITSWAREEEAEMRRRHGADYDAYVARTGRFLPRLRR
ncbi:MAG TPA: isoprenylcysteine carboxylmethyltransferase family protein [Actinomycetota bacterium]|nr:isoprenylcysteine carboxylmethyltransferase family protein [Actinomycetota bacterium]